MFPIFKLFVCFVIQCEPIRKNVLGKKNLCFRMVVETCFFFIHVLCYCQIGAIIIIIIYNTMATAMLLIKLLILIN